MEKLRHSLERPNTEPSNNCICGGTGWIRIVENACVTQCACLKKRILEKQLAVIPERFRESSFANYIPRDDVQKRALEHVQSKPSKSFFLWGGYGRGKTHLATAQYKVLVEGGQVCGFRTMAELISELRAAEVHDETSLVMQRAKYADSCHLFIDDLDKFKITEFKSEALFSLFDLIYRRKLSLTITSNYGLEGLLEYDRIHPAIVRRIDDICEALEV